MGGSQSRALPHLVQERRKEGWFHRHLQKGQLGHERSCEMRLGERGPMGPRAHGDTLVLGTSEHSKAQGSETAPVLRKNSPHPEKGPPRESSDASGSATCHWGIQAEVHNVKGISALGWAPFH